MTFVDRMLGFVTDDPRKSLLVEMHGVTKVPTPNSDTSDRIGRARGFLRAQGVVKGDRVVLVAPNSARWVAADLAILAEGAISVPMYARQAPAELAEMMHDAEPRVVIASDDALAEAIRGEWPEAPLVTFEALFRGDVIAEPAVSRADDDVATIIYTSGTSGAAKGVMLTMANIDAMLPTVTASLERLMGKRGEDDVVFHYLPFCFAGSRIVLWTCLYRNNPIHMSTDLNDLKTEFTAARPHYFLNVPTLLERIKNGVEDNLMDQNPAVVALYERAKRAYRRDVCGRGRVADGMILAAARALIFNKIKAKIGPRLECLICGSAPLGEDTQVWFEMLGIPVYQVYGLTETTAIATMD
ncbi:MAG: hypothetical protein DRJ42_31015, partial [Deltaproteobacteria bacterium]